jgi:hypothetical protein
MADVLGNRRVDEDLDSLVVGSPSRMQIKIYFNSSRDTDETLRIRCDKALHAAEYLAGKVK